MPPCTMNMCNPSIEDFSRKFKTRRMKNPLIKYLAKCKTRSKVKYNFQSLGSKRNGRKQQGGKYYIENYETFKKLYLSNYVKFTELKCSQLVFKNRDKSPICIDIDLRLSKPEVIPDKAFIDLASNICIIANLGPVNVVVTRRTACYYDESTKQIKHGCHIYLNVLRPKKFQVALRDMCLKHIDWSIFDRYSNIEVPEKMYDIALPRKSNGLILIGDRKKYKVASPHYICFTGTWDLLSWQHASPVTFERSPAVLREIFDDLYKWIWDTPIPTLSVAPTPTQKPDKEVRKLANRIDEMDISDEDEKEPIKAPTKPKKPTSVSRKPAIQKTQHTDGFNLERFIKAFPAKWIPGNEEYKKIVYFISNMEVDPATTCQLLNKAWGEPPSNRETETMLRKAGDSKIGIGSMVGILDRYAKPNWDRDFIFGNTPKDRAFTYFNDMEQFANFNKVSQMKDVLKFYSDVIQYTWGNGQTRFVYKETHEIRDYDRPIQVVNVCVTTKNPFNEFSDRIVKCNLSTKELIAQISKELKKPTKPKEATAEEADEYNKELVFYKKTTALIKKTRKKPVEENIKALNAALKEILGSEASKEHQLSALFKKFHQQGRLDRYYDFTCVPYSLHGDPTAKHTLNVFTGFPLAKVNDYTQVDVMKTSIWKWIWIVWANRTQYKMDWLLNAIATKLQRPHEKLNKFIVAYSEKTGSGKTTMRFFLQALTGIDTVFFCESMKNLTGDFTSQQLGKQWCIIDDIEKFSKSQSGSLKQRITSNTFSYRKMYSDPIQLPCYMDLIASSNSRTPVFIDTDDRRSELVECNPELKGQKDFWDAVYSEFKTTDVMKSWYTFLLERDLTGISFNEHYRFSDDAIAIQKVANLRSAYRFLLSYFERTDWMHETYDSEQVQASIKFVTSDKGQCIIITTTKLYEFYRRWHKLSGERNCLKMTTLYQEMENVGIKRVRHKINGERKRVFVLNQQEVISKIATNISVDESRFDICWVEGSLPKEEEDSKKSST